MDRDLPRSGRIAGQTRICHPIGLFSTALPDCRWADREPVDAVGRHSPGRADEPARQERRPRAVRLPAADQALPRARPDAADRVRDVRPQYTTLLTTRLRAVSQVTPALDRAAHLRRVHRRRWTTRPAWPWSSSTRCPASMHLRVLAQHRDGLRSTTCSAAPAASSPQRPLTDIETPLLRGLLDRVLGELRYAFEAIVDLRPKLVEIEYNPQFAQARSASDAVIVASFEMRVGAEECVATICLPFGAIFPELAGRRRGHRADRRAAAGPRHRPAQHGGRPRQRPDRGRGAVQLRPDAPRDLVGLRPGDVVPLEHPVTTPLAVTSAGVTFAHAVAGSSGHAAGLPRGAAAPGGELMTVRADRHARRGRGRGGGRRTAAGPDAARRWARRRDRARRAVRAGGQRPVHRLRAGRDRGRGRPGPGRRAREQPARRAGPHPGGAARAGGGRGHARPGRGRPGPRAIRPPPCRPSSTPAGCWFR